MIDDNQNNDPIPQIAREYLDRVIKKMRYRRKVRDEVRRELTAHFTDALADCENETQRKELAQTLIEQFGDAKLLARLIRRSKKRCRPWWQKAFGQTGKAILILWVITIPYNFWTIQSWRADAGNYLKKFNALNRPNVESSQNAWIEYQKAHNSFVEAPKELSAITSKRSSERIDLDDLSTDQKVILKQWFLDNESTWNHIINATSQEYYWWDIHGFLGGADGNDNEIGEHIKLFRPIAKMGRLLALYQADHGQTEQALQDCLTNLKMGFHLSQSKLLIEHLVGMAILSLGEKTIVNIINDQVITNRILDETQEQLNNLCRNGWPVTDLHAEYLYTLGSIGNVLRLNKIINPWMSLFPGHFLLIGNRNTIENKAILYFDKNSLQTPYELRILVENETKENVRFPISVSLLNTLIPALERACELNYRVKALYDSTVTILALKRWQVDKGEYPQRLEELVAAGLLNKLPDDPYSAGALIYERRGGDFILYSIGEDFEDSGGIENPDNEWGTAEAGGDRVFWPLR